MKTFTFANRDLSWLSFNKQVLQEALDEKIPLRERINFLAIFSSNLDEFYRVRYPFIQFMAQSELQSEGYLHAIQIKSKIDREISIQQEYLGRLIQKIRKALRENQIEWLYEKEIPKLLRNEVAVFFRNEVMGKLRLIPSIGTSPNPIFAPNGQIFLALYPEGDDRESFFIPLPTPSLPRFLEFRKGKKTFLIFLEDIIKNELKKYLPEMDEYRFFSFKVNRNAEMNLDDANNPKLAKWIKKEIKLRELGNPTRLLYQAEMPEALQTEILQRFQLNAANRVEGGTYHHLQDLFKFPLPSSVHTLWPITVPDLGNTTYFLDEISARDILIHPPYHNFDAILRLFNEAAIHPSVTEIYLTIYRVAKESKILQALITAALNRKKVTVFVELKARFDEENNLGWSEKMKAAGIRVKFSIPKLKVHAKAALIKLKTANQSRTIALLGTGNFNESTGKVYTDHFLFTSQPTICQELDRVFRILVKSPDKPKKGKSKFDLLWVGKFNLKERILAMIRRETQEALAGRRAEIILKMNNLEEEEVITALYHASQSGVTIRLLIRGICRLIPGKKGQSERISVKRIVDHYLEHGRIFWFFAGGKEDVYLGSADWMNRNLNRRIEICFPILDVLLKSEIKNLLEIQWKDNQKAQVSPKGTQHSTNKLHRSQVEICDFLAKRTK